MEGIQIRHLKEARVTLAARVEGSLVTVGVARCDKTDNFSRPMGRQIATGRAMSMRPGIKHQHKFQLAEVAREKYPAEVDWNKVIPTILGQ